MGILSNYEILTWTLTIVVTSAGCIGYYETCRRRDARRNGRLREQLLHAMSPVGPLQSGSPREGSAKTRARRRVADETEAIHIASMSAAGGENL
jgi:hypothetical protein